MSKPRRSTIRKISRFVTHLLSWYFSRRAFPYWTVLLVDSAIVLFSIFCIAAFDGGEFVSLNDESQLLMLVGIYWICYLIGFRLLHTYYGIIRYSSFADLKRLLYAIGVALALQLLLQHYLLNRWIYVPTAIILSITLLVLVLLVVERIWVKYLYDSTFSSGPRTPVFIYGIQNGGLALARSIDDPHSPYKLCGFISDNKFIGHKKLMDVDVISNDEHIAEHLRKHGAKALLVSPRKNDRLRANDRMINLLIEAGIHIFMTSPAREYETREDLNYSELRPVNVEDLLPRDKIEIDMQAVGDLLRDRRILITGAAGSIGSEIVRQIVPFNPSELILLDQAETPLHDLRLTMEQWPHIHAHTLIADITDEQRVEEIFRTYRPHYVFHAAAYKHVPMMEDNPAASIINNVEGTRILSDAAVRHGTLKFVMISTDKAVNPTNVMGASKRICEIYVQSLDSAVKAGLVAGNTQFVTTRFGNVLGSSGSVIPLFQRQIAAGGPLTVTHPDIIRYFMLIPEACKLVLEAGTMGHGGEVFAFDMGKPVRIADLARRMIRLSGAKDIEIKYTGLRSGEKLYEEVLTPDEETQATCHQMIKIARVRQYDYAVARSEVTALVAAVRSGADNMALVARMKAIVPEFKSQHSVYEQLDRAQ